jgi:hypothetical protein
MLKKLFNVIAIILFATIAEAQELNCKVKVMSDRIQGVDKSIFTGMERSIADFLNTRKWTKDQFSITEKIDCNVLINVTTRLEEDVYEATLNIQATRPIYNSGYNSSIVNYIDKELRFKFSPFVPLQFDDNRVTGSDALASNLPAVLAFYCYIILGLDYDSFSPNGGTEFLKKAQNIVNNAPEQGKTIVGWKAVDGNRNRYWLIDQILNPRFAAVRSYWYSYHREGLDNMYTKPAESQKLILDGIPKLVQTHRENPGSILMQFFFNAKSEEFMQMVAQVPPQERGQYITMLQQVDVTNAQKYNTLK